MTAWRWERSGAAQDRAAAVLRVLHLIELAGVVSLGELRLLVRDTAERHPLVSSSQLLEALTPTRRHAASLLRVIQDVDGRGQLAVLAPAGLGRLHRPRSEGFVPTPAALARRAVETDVLAYLRGPFRDASQEHGNELEVLDRVQLLTAHHCPAPARCHVLLPAAVAVIVTPSGTLRTLGVETLPLPRPASFAARLASPATDVVLWLVADRAAARRFAEHLAEHEPPGGRARHGLWVDGQLRGDSDAGGPYTVWPSGVPG
jgi:hypothetical protein